MKCENALPLVAKEDNLHFDGFQKRDIIATTCIFSRLSRAAL